MSLQEFKCPCCGGAINFDSASQKLKCPYCDTEFDLDTLKQYNEDLSAQPEEEASWDTSDVGQWAEKDGLKVYVCKSCGGEIVTDDTTAATSCPYCGNPVVMKEMLTGDLKPDLVIPFKLDKKAAKEALKRHMSGKKLLPRSFQTDNHLDTIKGVYVPYWLFDAEADADIRYKATRVRTWMDSRNMYTETSYYSVKRSGSLGFDGVPVDGATKMADDLMESIEPFDLSAAVDFQTAYLAGYLADRYDVSQEDAQARANQRIKASTENAFANTVSGYATVIPESTSIQSKGNARYGLLPVWILNTTYRGENYIFAMNGQTGKIAGDMPIDKGAWRKNFFGYGIGIGVILYALTWVLKLLG